MLSISNNGRSLYFQSLQVLLHHAEENEDDKATLIAQRDAALADRERLVNDLKSALAFKKQAHEDRRRAEDIMKRSHAKQEELKATVEKLKAEHFKDVENLKDYINQARAESSAKDEKMKALQSALEESEAAYRQLEKDMGQMAENYETHILEVDARARMELMKEYKSGEHVNWKPDDVIDDYFQLFPEEESESNPSQEDSQTINEMRAQDVNHGEGNQGNGNQTGKEQGGSDVNQISQEQGGGDV